MMPNGLCVLFLLCSVLSCIVAIRESIKRPYDVTIGQKSYSVLEKPPIDSPLVEEAHKEVIITINLCEMSEDMILIAKFLQVTENGLVSYPVIQGRVKMSQIELLQLTDKSEVAIFDFARASSRVIDSLESTHYHLYNGNIEMATKMYPSIAKEAEELAETARTLSRKYDQEVQKLKDILAETYATKEGKMKSEIDSGVQKGNLISRMKRLEKLKNQTHEKFIEMMSLFNEAKQNETDALQDENSFAKLLYGIASWVFPSYDYSVLNNERKKDAAKAYHASKLRYFEEMEKERDFKIALIADIAELTQNMSNIEDVQKLADEAIESLQSVIGRLAEFVAEFSKIAKFWDKMSVHLKDLQKEEQLKNALFLKNENERERVINSDGFKKALLNHSAKWIAMHEMTKFSRHIMKPVRDELASIVRGNLNAEESKKNMKKISQDLFAEQARRRKKIDEPRDEL